MVNNEVRGVFEEAMRLAYVPIGAPVTFEFLREQLAVEPLVSAAAGAARFPVPVLDVRAPRVYGRNALGIGRPLRILVHLPVPLGLNTNRFNNGLLYCCLRIRLL